MLKDSIEYPNPNLDFSISKGKTVDSILSFLDNKLPSFPKDLSAKSQNEDSISQECCIYLAREARDSQFMFHFQYKYPKGRSSDLSVISAEPYSSKEPLFIIEAKRLPTPGSGREREYVVGNLGGIERFKRGYHGHGLTKSAMFGYIQENSFDHWLSEINTWIINQSVENSDPDLSWNDTKEKLKLISTISSISKYSSSHARIRQSNITLFHYWILIPAIRK